MIGIAFYIFVFVNSCVGYYSYITHFTDEEIDWFPEYIPRDTIIFISQQLNYDTLFVVKNKIYDESRLHFINPETGHGSEDTCFAKYVMTYFYVGSNKTVPTGNWGYVNVTKTKTNKFDFDVKLIRDFFYKTENSDLNNIVQISLNRDTLNHNYDSDLIKSVTLKKGIGIDSYKTSSGEVFKRVEK